MPLEKTNASGFMKDTKKGHVINTNMGEYETILAMRQKKSCDEQLKQAVKELQDQMAELKQAVQKLQENND